MIKRYLLYKQHTVQHQEPSNFIAFLQATPPRALPRPPPPTMRNGRMRYPPISGRVSIISIAIYASRSFA
ncbi:hypothetical protein M405DRAFT_810268 [Rhizopogon salebrosus TDB-379]|nr:hypothetical protein M405DRAFT_810268 [Rhizopogon salebrosus TDB-379]